MKNPITQRKEEKESPTIAHELPVDTLCGLGFHPDSLQKCARLPCFVFVYSIAGFFTQTLSSYITSQITSIEKQFGLNSKQSGFLLSCNDIGFLAAVLFTSHFLARGTIPRYLALVTFLFGISGITCALPHFLMGVQEGGKGGVNATGHGDMLCMVDRNNSGSECSDQSQQSYGSAALALIACGMVLQGIAKSPRTALVTTYVDGNVTDKTRTGFMIGIITAVSILGAAVALGSGSIFSKLYVTLEEPEISPKDPRWIGAWWLGFVVFGFTAIVVSIPVSCFPKRLPAAYMSKNDDAIECDVKKQVAVIESKPQETKCKDSEKDNGKQKITKGIKDFVQVLRGLATNAVFMLVTFSTAMKMMAISGSASYSPKYLEIQFLEPAWKVNLIFGGLRLFDLFFGTLLGGYLTTRLKLTRTGNMKLILCASTISCVFSGLVMLFGCDQPLIHDFNRISQVTSSHVQRRSAGDACAIDCACDPTEYVPVCGENGVNYYSSCYAGCRNGTFPRFSECSCIGVNGTATAGICDAGCTHIIPYAVISFILTSSMTIQLIPIYMTVLRSVGEKEKSTAIGIGSLMNTLFGMLPGPILFGMIFDRTCLVWRESCNRKGSCALYHLEDLRISFNSLSLGLNVFSISIFLIGYFIASRKDRKSVTLTGSTSKDFELDVKF